MADYSDVRVLFVDDEANILKTLNRLMSLEDFDCEFANGGKEALQLLEMEAFDIVVSDMRMPEVTGDMVLTKAKELYPESIRFILSGYADFDSMMNALNEGGVQQFISKPWDDDVLIEKIKESADIILMRKETKRLRELTEKQTKELAAINKDLEARVEARTMEVKQTADMLDLSYQELRSSYSVFIDVIGQVLQLRSVAPKDHLNDIADTSRALAKALNQNEDFQDAVYKAAKLHELGKIRIPDDILKKPLNQIAGKELAIYKQYPLQGYSLLTSIDNLSEVSTFIRTHCERFDGKGFPAKMTGDDIPLGARIIAIVMNYFLYRNGLMDGRSHSPEDTERYIQAIAGKVVDPKLVELFLQVVNEELAKKGKHEARVQIDQAKAGMVLSRDLFNVRGVIMLTKGTKLSEKILEKLQFISDKDGADYALYVESKTDE